MRLTKTFLFITLSIFVFVGPVLAQEPLNSNDTPFLVSDSTIQTITSFTITPNAAPIGSTVAFSGDYDVSNPGIDQTAFCFYFAAADAAGWDSTFTNLGSINVSFFKRGISACPAVTGYGSLDFYTTDTSLVTFGDTFMQDVIVPTISSGGKTIGIRQYEGTDCSSGSYDTVSCAFVNSRSTSFTAQAAPTTVYADPAGSCGSSTPCYTDLGMALDAVADGGTVNVYGTFNNNVLVDKNLILQSATMATIGGTLTVDGVGLTARGLTFTGSQPFVEANLGTITAYANNITNFGTPPGNDAAHNLNHNWWASYTAQPGGMIGIPAYDEAWSNRLGAAVEAYGIGSLGNAAITGGTGTAIIVSHGRGDNSAPFGQATVEDGNTQCSDYYDVFVQSGSGNWNVSLPVDAGSGCDSVYQGRHIAVLNMANTGCMDGSQVGSCWNSALDTWSITQLSDPRRLRVNNMSTAALQGTPIVAGNQDNLTPTVIALHNLQAGHGGGWMLLTLTVIGLLLSGAAVWVNGRRRTGSR